MPQPDLRTLLTQGWVTLDPVVYEDFLPRSAAGIFRSNLDSDAARRADEGGAALDTDWLSGALNRPVLDPDDLYQQRHDQSLGAAVTRLGLAPTTPRSSP